MEYEILTGEQIDMIMRGEKLPPLAKTVEEKVPEKSENPSFKPVISPMAYPGKA